MLELSNYDITTDRGFLTPYDMDEVILPDDFALILHAAGHLSDYITAGCVQVFLDKLPEIDMNKHLENMSDAQLRMLMVHYSFIVQSYVWGEEGSVPLRLPRNIAIPYCKLADKIGQYPLLPYTAYTLDNWSKLDKDGPITCENIRVIQNFINGQDENWFIMIHIEIEAKAGPALAAIPCVIKATKNKDMGGVVAGLIKIRDAWEHINPVFDKMPDKCDPYIYYNRVRPYIHGWKGNPAIPEGLIYEGVDKYEGKPQSFRGQTGSQSSIVPTMDAFLGIGHEDDPLKEYLDELHEYRPPRHRKFIEDVRENSTLRNFVMASGNAELTMLYNEIIGHVQRFRTRHLEYAANYINKQARGSDGNPVDVGTGGTPFMKYLKKHRDESVDHMLPMPESGDNGHHGEHVA